MFLTPTFVSMTGDLLDLAIVHLTKYSKLKHNCSPSKMLCIYNLLLAQKATFKT